MAKIGLIPISGKPYHAGHDGLVRLAAGECDVVHLFVSTSDRKRPGEVPILGSDMQTIWHEYIEGSLPGNVQVTYGGSPVGNLWKELGEANEQLSDDTYVIYSDVNDIAKNFPEALLVKYAKELNANGQVQMRPIQRTETVNVSGTRMREFLKNNDKESFIKNLPQGIAGREIWNILRKSATTAPAPKKAPTKRRNVKGESLIREYVMLQLSRQTMSS